MLSLTFEPVDTWHFREARPYDAAGGGGTETLFPPAPSTLVGALRTRLGDLAGINWRNLKTAPSWWGSASDYGDLQFFGPWLIVDGKRLLPAPACLMRTAEDGFVRLRPGAPVRCDLGLVQLPMLPAGLGGGVRPLEGTYIDEGSFMAVLQGRLPGKDAVIVRRADLFANEERLGIALNAGTRSAEAGFLYQTKHLRPKAEHHHVALQIGVEGVPDEWAKKLEGSVNQSPLIRFGADGRMARLGASRSLPLMTATEVAPDGAGLMLVLLTDLALTDNGFLSPDSRTADGGIDRWQLTVAGLELTLCCIGSHKARRRGGWDLANNRPKGMSSYLPAGTTLFCQMPICGWAEARKQLDGGAVGAAQELNRGLVAVGWWK